MGYVVEPAKRIGVVEYDFSNKRSVDDAVFNRQRMDLIAKLRMDLMCDVDKYLCL